jgi:sugar phosphate isomerase/epimerase
MNPRRPLLAALAALVLFAAPHRSRAHPFFAMDTGISGEPSRVAAVLHDLGYGGLGGSGTSVKPMREALEKQGSRLWNVYLTLKFQADTPALTPELQRLIADLKGHDAALWIAISEVTGGDETAAKSLVEIADYARGAGVKLSLYPHTGFWLSRFSDAARLASRINREDVGITFNLCHWLKVEGDIDPLPAIAKEVGLLQFVTINGADHGDTKAMGWDKLIRPLDQGTYDTGSLVRRLRDELKWNGPVGLQSFGIPGDQQENLARSMAAWRKMSPLPADAPPGSPGR